MDTAIPAETADGSSKASPKAKFRIRELVRMALTL
jgi:hypothetical protein